MPLPAFLPSTPLPTATTKARPQSCPIHPPLRANLPLTIPTNPPIETIDPFNPPPPSPTSTTPSSPPNPVIIIPGYAASHHPYQPMAASLRHSLPPDTHVAVVPIHYHSWFPTLGGRPVTPILHLLHRSIRHALAVTGAHAVTLVAHSAAGWIARIYLGHVPYPVSSADKDTSRAQVWNGHRLVDTLVCLGTPHRSDEKVARLNMDFVNQSYPGAYFDNVTYVNLAGDGGTVGGDARTGSSWNEWFCRMSYRMTDGALRRDALVAGDGIVPLSAAFLDNAQRNIRLKGVWHSPASRGPWYGDPSVVKYWSRFVA